MRVPILFLSLAIAVSAQVPSAEQAIGMRRAMSPAISPDGKRVAYTVSKTNWDDNSFESEIWVAETSGSRRFRLTGGKKSSSGPAWSPDGSRIAFASDRDGKRQLYLISPDGGEAVLLFAAETPVGGFEWTPDGAAIIFTASKPESEAEKERKKKFGEFTVVKEDYTRSLLWKVKVPPASDMAPPAVKPEILTDAPDLHVTNFAVSPDGKRVAFSAKKDPDLSSEPDDVYVLNLADRFVKMVAGGDGPQTGPVWSPDSRRIAFSTVKGPNYYYENNVIATVDADGGASRVVPLKFDEDVSVQAWAPDGLYFGGFRKGAYHLYRLNPDTGEYAQVTAGNRLVVSGAPSFTRDWQQMAFAASIDGAFPEIYHSAVKSFASKALTDMGAQFKDFKTATREMISWKSTDGTVIEGVLIKPPDFDPSRKYPLLVMIHGGPTGIDLPILSPDRVYPVERFVAKGALVLQPNYRGSAGYGEKFRSLNVRNLGVGDAWDVVSGVDYLIAKGWVDKDRVGAMGWSQGGYISAFLTTSSTRFKAISVGAGISNWYTYYVNTDIQPFTRMYLKATPWDDMEIYRKTSPMTYIKQAKTPTLIQHGEFDKRVPTPNAYELFQGLQDQGVPVKMYIYKGFGHGISKPKELMAAQEHNYQFFAEHIWGEKPAK